MLNAKILLVTEELKDINTIEAVIEKSGYETLVGSTAEFTSLFQNFQDEPHLIVCHFSQKKKVTSAWIKGGELPMLLISGTDEKVVMPSGSAQKIAYLTQPFSTNVLTTLVNLLLSSEG